ncbi:MAG: hypothetical protein J6Q48_02345 [Bacteroidaceae bacterium]|nr:hypothetical protein [Bacteroidaceae bacterium]
MEFGSKEYNSILKGFKKGQEWLNDVVVDIEDGENVLPPLVLLRAYEQEPTIDSSLALAAQMVMNKHVKFVRGSQILHEFTYNGGDLSEKFEKAPYLLDLLLKLCYGLMVKKLTPPSEDSEKEE